MKKVKPLIRKFTTEREIAEYYFNREFSTVSLDLLKSEDETYEVLRPSTYKIIQEWFDTYSNIEEILSEYNEEQGTELTETTWNTDDDFISYIENRNDFEDYLYGDYEQNNYPMWGWVFRCDSFYVDSNYMNVDKLYDIGIGVLEFDGEYYLFISGAGYDFYEAHWIPLFREIGWIEYEN